MNRKSLNLIIGNLVNLIRTIKDISHLKRVKLLFIQVSNSWSSTLIDLTPRTATVNTVAIQYKATATFLFNIASHVIIGWRRLCKI